jgi:hypothetical protein
VLTRLAVLRERHGDAYNAPELLIRLAREGKNFALEALKETTHERPHDPIRRRHRRRPHTLLQGRWRLHPPLGGPARGGGRPRDHAARGHPPDRVEQIIFGIVSAPVGAPNIAREIGLEAAFPMSVPAYTVSQACISSNQAITNAADQIALGKSDVILAGGAETLSDVPILYGRKFRDALFVASKARSVGDRLRAFRGVRLKDLAPVAPAIAEPSSGQTMGQSAEKMAKDFGIRRAAQDRFAANSHAARGRGLARG